MTTEQLTEWLAERGFDPKRIRVVFNQYANDGVPLDAAFRLGYGYIISSGKLAPSKPIPVSV